MPANSQSSKIVYMTCVFSVTALLKLAAATFHALASNLVDTIPHTLPKVQKAKQKPTANSATHRQSAQSRINTVNSSDVETRKKSGLHPEGQGFESP